MTALRSMTVFVAAVFAGLAAQAAEPGNYAVIGHIPGADGRWDMVAFDSSLRRVLVSREDGVMALNVDDGKVTPQLTAGDRVHIAIPIPGGNILVTNGKTDTAVIADARDGKVKATIPTGKNPDAAAFDPVTGLVFVMNGKSGDITMIDPKKLAGVGQLAVGGKLEFAVADGGGHLFVNLEDSGEIAVVDTRARKVTGRYKLDGCEEPSGLAYAKKERLLISACANGKAMVVTAGEGKVVKELTIGPKPDGALYDEERRLAFIPSGGNGTLAVIKVSGPNDVAVIQMVPTKVGARTLTEDPKTGKLYLPVAEMNAPVAPDTHPTLRPGTFELLVVGPAEK